MTDNLYIVKVGKVYLSHDFDNVGKYTQSGRFSGILQGI